jgi:hypothetical protein
MKPCSKCGKPNKRLSQRYCLACHAAYMRANRTPYLELSPEQKAKVKARSVANTYQKRGLLKKENCFVCEDPNAQKHHEDYSRPLDILWLCKTCHVMIHNNCFHVKAPDPILGADSYGL